MSTTLERPERTRISFVSGTFADDTRLLIVEDMSFEQWVELGRKVIRYGEASAWWIGDWIVHGESSYGISEGTETERRAVRERLRRILDEFELAYDRVRDYAYVSGRVPFAVRTATLSWSHHRVVADIARADEQERWLERAEAEGWSVRQLKEAIDPPTPAVLSPLRLLLQERRPEIKAVADLHGEKVEQCVARLLGEALDRELLAVAA